MPATLHYKYLIIGAGMTADAAVRGIRESDSEGTIGLIGAEEEGPYDRPPLTKGLWKGKPVSKIWRGTEGKGADLHLGRRAMVVDPQGKSVTDDQSTVYTYDRLLLATGGTPRRLPIGADNIIYYRTLDDYRHLRALADRDQDLLVIGAGFIGTEIAAALNMNGRQVTMLFPEAMIGARVFPQDLAQFVHEYYVQRGVRLLPGHTVSGIDRQGDEQLLVKTQDLEDHPGPELVEAGVIAGLGIQPNVALAESAGIKTENGILVDESLRTNLPDIYAAGDVANFYNPALDRRLRVEHEDNANTMGLMAGRSMAGQPIRYDHLPFFYSDMFDLGYEAVGELDARLETFGDWQEPLHKGVVYYLRDGRVRGVLLWNIFGQVEAASNLIAEPGPFSPQNLKGRLHGA